jgi:multicomponent K+:H+ antiporter subunit E
MSPRPSPATGAPRSLRQRWLPSPLLSLALWVLWILLNQSMSPGTLLLGALLGWLLPVATLGLRPTQPHVRRPVVALRLALVVILDMSQSAFHILRTLVTHQPQDIRAAFVHVPLELRDPHALAVLAMILCLTPGTAWAEVSLDRSMLLLHVLDPADEALLVAQIKQRYERPLMEIFE